MLDNVLVTGGAGFLGSALTEKLLLKKKKVTVFDNLFRGKRNNFEKNNVNFIYGDICDKNDVTNAVRDIDTIFHFAAIQGTKNFYEIPHTVLKVNVEGTINILNAAINSSVKRVVFASSSEVYGNPMYFPTDEEHPLIIPQIRNPRYSYAASKIIGESLCLNYARIYGLDIIILRPHNIYGPRMGFDHVIPEFIMRILNNEPFTIQGSGNNTRSFCFISDAIECILLAVSKKTIVNEIFNIGNPEEITINSLASLLIGLTGVSIKPTHIVAPEGGTSRRFPDISKAKNILGYEPRVPLSEGLSKTFNWYKHNIKIRV